MPPPKNVREGMLYSKNDDKDKTFKLPIYGCRYWVVTIKVKRYVQRSVHECCCFEMSEEGWCLVFKLI